MTGGTLNDNRVALRLAEVFAGVELPEAAQAAHGA